MMPHSGKHTDWWGLLPYEVYSSVKYANEEKNGCHEGQIAMIVSTHMIIVHVHATTTRHANTANGKIFFIQLVQSQTTIILGITRCEGLGFHLISILRHHASSHFHEASSRKFNVTPHRLDGEVNLYFKLNPWPPPRVEGL